VENIEDRDTTVISNIPDMVGSGQSVGGVVSETVLLGFFTCLRITGLRNSFAAFNTFCLHF